MAANKQIIVPDIGGATDVDVIEVLVKKGDKIDVDTPLITLESDKASMEIPSTEAGVVKSVVIQVGDKVSEGATILEMSVEGATGTQKTDVQSDKVQEDDPKPSTTNEPSSSQSYQVVIPDIGGATDVDVIEIMVAVGDVVTPEQSLITLEGDKATMDIPSPVGGKVESISVKIGDKVSQGDSILTLMTEESKPNSATSQSEKQIPAEETQQSDDEPASAQSKETLTPREPITSVSNNESEVHAGPAVRRIASEFGVDLGLVKGTGRKSRITKEDVQNFVKQKINQPSASASLFAPKVPQVDFSAFGDFEVKPLNKIKRLTGEYTHSAWVSIPHVTQFDEADITALEAFRKSQADEAKAQGYKLTLLAFVCKAAAKALAKFPQFNSSLDATGEALIYKKYTNIGIAVETPNGLVVPVIRHVDKLSVSEIAKEMARLSSKAREKGLAPADMSGGCFTISSLGGIGGTAFTPIVNAPEVAILGLSRSSMKPVFENGAFEPRLMLPLSLSYDHRVIDGAEAARFTRYLADCIHDIRRIIL